MNQPVSKDDTTKNSFDDFMRDYTPTAGDMLKFVIISLFGAFLFMAPIPGDGAFNIPLGIAINWLEDTVFHVSDGVNIAEWLLLAFVTISAVGTVLTHMFKPEFKNQTLKSVFYASPLYTISRIAGLVFVWMIHFEVGPEFIVSPGTGGVMMGISTHLVSVFFILGFAIPLLTDFGIMEFTGILIRKIVRVLFTLPGRSSVDLMASWFGSSTASVILTRGQHEKGYYTGREAAVICVNFSFVSLPFSFVIANAIGINSHFIMWYVIICITCVLLALITPRIWPLRGLPDTYVEGVGQQIAEETPEGVSPFQWALKLAAKRAHDTSARQVINNGIDTYINIFMDLVPLVVAWGTLSLAIFEFTPIFQYISIPMGWFLQLFNIPGAMEFAPATLIGFLDMYLPAILLGAEGTPVTTQFILGALSVVQIIYMTETGILIAKSNIPLNVGKLFVIFMIRTLIAIPVITLLTNVFVNF